ncbi:MAG: GNAT family N-acetyltransferase [Nocardioides sp.]
MSARAVTQVALRPVTSADRVFLLGVYDDTRAAELAQVAWQPGQREAFVQMQFDLQDRQYREQNPHGCFDVIEADGVPAGRLYVDRRPTDIRIVDIALAPAFRGRGIGGELIRSLIREAVESGRSVSIHVEIHNPAARLYERLGFVVADERGVYRRMDWRAA